jgi:hypothetical protein
MKTISGASGDCERTIIDSWRFAEQFLDFPKPLMIPKNICQRHRPLPASACRPEGA